MLPRFLSLPSSLSLPPSLGLSLSLPPPLSTLFFVLHGSKPSIQEVVEVQGVVQGLGLAVLTVAVCWRVEVLFVGYIRGVI